jgi:hypothetical protein
MKVLDNIRDLFACFVFVLALTGCERGVTEFGFDSAISGMIKDQAGNIVPGTTTSNTLSVQILGETDKVATVIRVKGDGSYQNIRLLPTRYRIWVSGPVTLVGDTVRADLSAEKTLMKDLIVVPFIRVKLPAASDVTAETVNVNYDMSANNGKTVATRELYCSTNPYPDASIGSGPFYDTKKVVLTGDQGVVTVAGLASRTKYYIRIGAQATGASGMNFSDQITITTP